MPLTVEQYGSVRDLPDQRDHLYAAPAVNDGASAAHRSARVPGGIRPETRDVAGRRLYLCAGFDRGEGGTEGQRYLRLARELRSHLTGDTALRKRGLRDLAELDMLIWFSLPE
jgi:hypothetical protein